MNTRAAVLVAAILLCIATPIFYAPNNANMVFMVLLTDGLCAALWLSGAIALGAFLLRTLKIQADPLLFTATAGGLGLGIFSLLALTLGLLGCLNHATALAMPITGAILFLADLAIKSPRIAIRGSSPINAQPIKAWLKSPANRSWLWLIPTVSLTTAAVAATIMPGDLWKPLDPHPYDVISYHLQVPREWYEAGKIQPLSHNVFSYFPMNVEMQYLSLMHAFGGPWRAMYICQFMSVAYMLLMLLALAADGGIVGAAIASCVPWVIMLGSVAYVESALMLYTALAIIWALRGGMKETLIAAAMTGLAAGVKITAVPMLLLAIPPAMIVMRRRPSLLSPSPGTPGEGRGEGAFPSTPKNLLQNQTLFLLVSLLVLSPWLIRNFLWAGNPIFPVAMNLLGRAHFTIEQVQRFRQAHSPTQNQQSLTSRLTILWTDVLAHWQYGFIILPAALLTVGLKFKDRRTWATAAVAAIIFIVWIGFTHLLPRFLIQLIPLAAILIGTIQWQKTWPAAIALVLFAAALGWSAVSDRLTFTTRDPVRSQLIGREDLSFTIPPELADMKDSDKQVALIGDAEAFLYQIPMSRLHYRTVFDIPTNTTDPIEAWASVAAKNNPNWLLVVNPSEIKRLHETYRDVPSLPPQWADHGDQPFVLNGQIPSPKSQSNPNSQ